MLGKQNRKAELWFNHAPDRVVPPAASNHHRADMDSAHGRADAPARDRAGLPPDPMLEPGSSNGRADAPTRNPKRPAGTVYHFLLPDPGMAAYGDKAAKALEPACFERIADWRKRFFKPFADDDIAELEALSDRVDALWGLHAEQLARDHRETEDALPVWGRRARAGERQTTNTWKDRIRNQGVFSHDARTASPYRRLKLVMDYWCALWFWPIRDADKLPDRDEFLNEVSLVLTGSVYQPGVGPQQTADLFGAEYAEHAEDIANRITDEVGMLDLDKLWEQFPRLKFVDELAERHRFHHWELAFADLFYGERADGSVRGGFDLVLGNPPWIKVEWEEGGVLGDYNPLLVLRRLSARELTDRRADAFGRSTRQREAWLRELEEAEATQAFLNAWQNYALLAGQQTNLYKCFLPQAWMVGSERAAAGFLHPEGVYDDPKGGMFREALYLRLRAHFQFQNEKKLFAEVDHHKLFSVNVYGPARSSPSFNHVANLFAPATVDASTTHDGSGPPPGIKDDANDWSTAGHADRVVQIDRRALDSFVRLYDAPGTPTGHARLPALHAGTLLAVLRRLVAYPKRLADLQDDLYVTAHWHETMSQRERTIRPETRFPRTPAGMILSGPHFFVGNPHNKTPRRECTLNSHYDVLDLTALPDDYLPRTNYVPACNPATYGERTPRPRWIEPDAAGKSRRVTDYYRVVNRRMVGPLAERTLITSLVPKGVAHVHTTVASAFRDPHRCVELAALSASVVLDFFVKSTGTTEMNLSWLSPPADPDRGLPPRPARSAVGSRAAPQLPDHALRRPVVRAVRRRPAQRHRGAARRRRRRSVRDWHDRTRAPFHRRLPHRHLDAPGPPAARRLGCAAADLEPQRRPAHRLRPSAGARRDRCPRRSCPQPDPRRAAHYLPCAVPRHAPVRGRHMVRRHGPHRLHRLQGPARRRPAPQGGQGRHLLDLASPRGRHPVGHRARMGGHPRPPHRRHQPPHTGRHAPRRPRRTRDRVPRTLRPL